MANGLCDKFCKDCLYAQTVNSEGQFCCVYYLVTNKRRPCPAGIGCTVKTAGKAKGAWRYKNDAEWGKKMKEAREAKKVYRTVVCVECGTEFESAHEGAKYCSKRCCNRVSQRNAHQRLKIAKAERAKNADNQD